MIFKNVLIIGNLNTGKTSISKRLAEYLQLECISIDDLRKKYGDGSFSKEYLAWSKFFELIEGDGSIILEFSGAGIHKHGIKESLSRNKNNWLIILVYASMNELIKRPKEKKIATPYPWKISGFNNLELINQELQDDWENNFWNCSNFKKIKILNTSSIENSFKELLKNINLL